MSFSKIESHELKDLQSVGHLYQHDESGAQVLHIENDDKNKAFTIGFATPPYNDNGITHILEHSVLNGSKKFPSKEPFVEIVKGSMNTFINAMTFSDKTIYPVASTNDQDFSNLMSVYLDAVFQPLFIDNPQILAQEGWHYHLESVEDDLIYKGVVYNEMKGATASPESQLYHYTALSLYPDSIYSHESGGVPAAIPSLTQEEFIDYHETYYHPSNSLTVLYGDLDIDQAFNHLSEYFDGKGKLEDPIDVAFDIEAPESKTFEATYSITEGDDPKDKDYLALNWHVGTADDVLENQALEILEEILLGNQQSPLRKALLDAEIGGDISGGLDRVGFPLVFNITAKYSDASKMDEFKEVVKNTLTDLVEKGIDSELIQASINKIVFQLKEQVISESSPRGVIYAISAYETWLYGGMPYDGLEFSETIEELRGLSENGYFEKLIQEKLLNNDHRVALTLKAEPGKNDKLEAELHQELQEYKAGLEEAELQQLVEETQQLIERQESADSPEDLAKIPSLSREDLSTEVEHLPMEKTRLFEEGENNFFYQADLFTSGIDYVDFYLDIADLPSEDYSLLSLISNLLSNLATENLSVEALQRKIDLHTGGIHAGVRTFTDVKNKVKPYFVLTGKALEASLDELLELMFDILANTLFDDEKEIYQIIQRLISQFEMMINYQSHVLAANRAMSHWTADAKLSEYTNGIDYFYFLKEQRQLILDGKFFALSQRLKDGLAKLINKARLNLLYIGDQERSQIVKEKVLAAFDGVETENLAYAYHHQPGKRQNEAFRTAQDVNYVGLAAEAENKLPYNGASNVLSNEIRYGYLWNMIRVKGGAYGSMYRHQRTGNFMLSSYRDPNIKETIDAYYGLPDFVKNLEVSEADLLKDIIGTLSPLERPRSARDKGLLALGMEMTGYGEAEFKQLKEEVIETTAEDMTALAQPLAEVLKESSLAVIGNKAQIDKQQDLFDEIFDLY